MAVFQHVQAIEVIAWGHRVGAIAASGLRDTYAFEYDRGWVRREIELAPFTMPVSQAPRIFTFPDLEPETFRGMPGLVADALPDHFGNRLIDAWMATHGYRPETISPLDRLAYMGQRAMGALEFRPMRGPSRTSTTPVQLGALVEQARQAVAGHLNDADSAEHTLNELISVGTSAGGARAKAVLGWNPTTGELRSGQFDLPDEFEHWLLKFDGVGADPVLGPSQQYGRIEYAYYQMATAAGITMSPCRLLEEHGRAHFMTRRFDRTGPAKVHVQSLCALRHASYKYAQVHAYETLFITADQLGLGDAAMNQLFRRLVFNVAARNCDDHTKNVAFLMHEGRGWELAPAYDITYAYNPDSVWTRAHQMSVGGKFSDITKQDLRTLADRFSIPGTQQAFDDVEAAVARWPEFAAQAGVGRDEIQRIRGMHRPAV